MEIYARQGDLVIDRLTTPIEGDFVMKRDLVFAGDSSGNRHRLLGEVSVSTSNTGRTTRFRVQAATELIHEKADGHHTTPMVPGDYEIRILRERGDGADRAVED